jgi:hypothetical protein
MGCKSLLLSHRPINQHLDLFPVVFSQFPGGSSSHYYDQSFLRVSKKGCPIGTIPTVFPYITGNRSDSGVHSNSNPKAKTISLSILLTCKIFKFCREKSLLSLSYWLKVYGFFWLRLRRAVGFNNSNSGPYCSLSIRYRKSLSAEKAVVTGDRIVQASMVENEMKRPQGETLNPLGAFILDPSGKSTS